jgi:hypothetical protein
MTVQKTIEIRPYHEGQQRPWDQFTRFSVLRCGRRWGKSELLTGEAATAACSGLLVGWFAPDYKRLMPSYALVSRILLPVTLTSNKTDRLIETIVPCIDEPSRNGTVEFWTLGDIHAGRSRRYHLVIIDEAAFAGPDMMKIWSEAIKPTLLDRLGQCIVASNTYGNDSEQFFWKICNEKKYRFSSFHAPSSDNPFMPAEEIEDLRKTEHPLVFAQEYLAEFVDWSGAAFFLIEKVLVRCELVNDRLRRPAGQISKTMWRCFLHDRYSS